MKYSYMVIKRILIVIIEFDKWQVPLVNSKRHRDIKKKKVLATSLQSNPQLGQFAHTQP